MDKLDGKTKDIVGDNIQQLKQLFPEAFTEDKVDFDMLKSLLGEHVETSDERYSFTWHGKSDAIKIALKQSTGTLRPDKESSKNWDETENLYIEGDNLEVLRILQSSYRNKIKMIYIDPPYNTGKDFVYTDNFNDTVADYKEKIGEKYKTNADSSGRYHTNWLNMMYPRLKLARNLLTEDGAIFISIDDNEQANLKKLCDEIFGEENFLACITNITGANQAGEGVLIQKNTEYLLVYGKECLPNTINRVDKVNASFRSLRDAPTPLSTRNEMGYTVYYNPTTKDFKPVFDYDKDKINTNDVSKVYQDDLELIKKGYIPIRPGIRNGYLHRWRWGVDTLLDRKDEIVIKDTDNGWDIGFIQEGLNPPKNYFNYSVGTTELKKIFDDKELLEYPKSTKYIKYLISIGGSNGLILDFFSGSATTAHATMQLNAEDGGNRKFIMVQLPEETDEKSEAYKAGYKTIPEIGRERIRRAGEKILQDHAESLQDREQPLDVGFKTFTLDTTNLTQWDEKTQDVEATLFETIDAVKEDRSQEDVVYEVLLKYGVDISTPIETEELAGKTLYKIAGGYLTICLDEGLDQDFIEKLAEQKPSRVVFRDTSFADDTVKINAEMTLKKHGIEDIKVL